MSLAVLGAPGKAIAQSLDANKITADQAIELVKKKVASGEIKPDQLQNLDKSVQKPKGEKNQDPMLPGIAIGDMTDYKIDDQTKKNFSLATLDGRRIYINDKAHPYHGAWFAWYWAGGSSQDPNVQNIQGKDDAKFAAWYFNTSEYGKDSPRFNIQDGQDAKKASKKTSVDVKKDEPKKADSAVNTNLSDFMMKGIRFGMTMEQTLDALEKQFPDRGSDLGKWIDRKIYSRDSGVMTVDFNSLLGVYGSSGMSAKLNFSKSEGLYQIIIDEKPEVIEKLVDRLILKFGNPDKFYDTRWQNQAGAVYPNKFFMWNNVNGAVIKGEFRGNTRDQGNIAFISTKSYQDAVDFNKKYTQDKIKSDF